MKTLLSFSKFVLISLIILIFSSCARTPALINSITNDTLKPEDIEEFTASSTPLIVLSATQYNSTNLAAEEPTVKKTKPSLIKSIKRAYNLKELIKSNSSIPKSENFKKPKNFNSNIATIKIFLGIILVLLGIVGLIAVLFPYSITILTGNISFPISVLIAMLAGISIIGGIGLIVRGTAH